jgi:nucleoside permease NupC
MGTTFLGCGAVVFLINLIGTFRALPRPDASSTALSTSALWLVVMMLLGAPFAKEAPLAWLTGRHWSEAWLVFSFTGVFLNALTGIALKVTAQSLGTPQARSDAPWYALAFTNAGLAWLFAATTFGPMAFVIFCAAVYLVGIVIFLSVFWGILQRRTVASLGWDARILLTAFALLPVAVGLFMLAAWDRLVAPVVQLSPGLYHWSSCPWMAPGF